MQPGLDPRSITRDIEARSAELRQRAMAIQAELARLQESVTSPDRIVTVTVGAGGVMRGIKVEPTGLRATPTQWADAVMKAYAQGCRIVGERAAELMERHTPGSPVVAMMRDALPPEPDEDSERGR